MKQNITEEQVKEELRKPLGYISKWLIQLRRECSKAQGYTPGEKQVVHMNLSKIQTELEVAKLILKEDCFPLISSLLQKEREAGKREGIEDLKKLIEKSRGNDYHNIGIGELDYHEKCAVDAYIETLKSRMSKLKSQSVEKGNDFKFDNKGNSIP